LRWQAELPFTQVKNPVLHTHSWEAEQVCPSPHAGQFSVPPHPLSIEPHAAAAQVFGVQQAPLLQTLGDWHEVAVPFGTATQVPPAPEHAWHVSHKLTVQQWPSVHFPELH
jgi:hypothetical protein